MSDTPILRLRPKKSATRFRHGDPWVFADEVVLDRRTRALPIGTLVIVETAERIPFAIAAINPEAKLIARILDLDATAQINTDWITAKVQAALTHRERLYPDPYYRMIHGEADGLPGLIVDRFGDVVVMQPNAAWVDTIADDVAKILADVTGATTIYLNAGSRARQLEGLDGPSRFLIGNADGLIPVKMNGATYMADIIGGQKTGLFFDQRENHAFAASLAKGQRVLDVFSHIGGFGLACLAAGGRHAVCVDASAPALDLAEQSAKASGVADKFEARKGDAVAQMRAMAEAQETFDLVICDPPAFAPNKNALQAGLRGYEKVAIAAAKLVAPGGYLVLCSCSQAADLGAFRETSLRGIGRAGRRMQVIHTGFAGPDHPQHARLADAAYLKAIVLRCIEG